jgi:hypothetical protein
VLHDRVAYYSYFSDRFQTVARKPACQFRNRPYREALQFACNRGIAHSLRQTTDDIGAESGLRVFNCTTGNDEPRGHTNESCGYIRGPEIDGQAECSSGGNWTYLMFSTRPESFSLAGYQHRHLNRHYRGSIVLAERDHRGAYVNGHMYRTRTCKVNLTGETPSRRNLFIAQATGSGSLRGHDPFDANHTGMAVAAASTVGCYSHAMLPGDLY